MPDEEKKEEAAHPIEVAIPEVKKGTVEFMSKAAFSNPAPEKMKRVINALVYFCAGLGGVVGATDLFTGRQSKIIAVVLAIIILGLGSLKIAIGVKPEDKE